MLQQQMRRWAHFNSTDFQPIQLVTGAAPGSTGSCRSCVPCKPGRDVTLLPRQCALCFRFMKTAGPSSSHSSGEAKELPCSCPGGQHFQLQQLCFTLSLDGIFPKVGQLLPNRQESPVMAELCLECAAGRAASTTPPAAGNWFGSAFLLHLRAVPEGPAQKVRCTFLAASQGGRCAVEAGQASGGSGRMDESRALMV